MLFSKPLTAAQLDFWGENTKPGSTELICGRSLMNTGVRSTTYAPPGRALVSTSVLHTTTTETLPDQATTSRQLQRQILPPDGAPTGAVKLAVDQITRAGGRLGVGRLARAALEVGADRSAQRGGQGRDQLGVGQVVIAISRREKDV